jgi:hypothetical protein
MNLQNKKIPDKNVPINKISNIIDNFQKITLEEINDSGASLLNRKESKYLMTTEQCLLLISELSGKYRVFEIDNSRMSRYETIYYDNDAFLTYHQHHNGRSDRYKLRIRHYLSSGESYVEVKHKKNTGVTVKKRIKTDESLIVAENEQKMFLKNTFPYDINDFHPVLTTEYLRVTLVSNNYTERITLDADLSFKNNNKDKSCAGLVIGEVKRDKAIRNSDAMSTIKQIGIRESGFSKYCIGVALLYDNLKHNRFKPKLLYASKLLGGIPVC